MNPLLSALTASGIITADVAAMVDRQMSPLDAQAYAEGLMLDAFRNGLKAQEIRYLDLVNAANGKPPEQQLAMFWQDENDALYRSVEGALVQVASDRAVQISIATGNADMWAVVNEEIIDWVGEYYQSFDPTFVGSIPNLNVTSRTLIGQAFNDWQRGEIEGFGAADGLPQLIRALEPTFGVKRATTIAVTETTRVFNESTVAAGRANPLITRYRFFSAADDRVCPICGPLHNSISSPNKANPTFNHPSLGALPIPPLHVNCRCQAVPETDVTLQFDSNLPRPYTWSPETPEEYAKRRRDELAKTRPPTPKPPKAKAPEATLPPAPPPEPPKVAPAEAARNKLKAEPYTVPYRSSDEIMARAVSENDKMIGTLSKAAGVSPVEFEKTVISTVENVVANVSPSIRSDSDSAISILKDGRFKSQFESNKSGGGFSTKLRRDAEEWGIGVPRNISVEKRPIYGYFKTQEHGAGAYGNVEFVLKDTVRERTTITVGDSLSGFADKSTVGVPLNSITKASFADNYAVGELYKTGRISEGYIEAQIHGGVTIDDVFEVIVHPDEQTGRSMSRELRDICREKGIKVSYSEDAD